MGKRLSKIANWLWFLATNIIAAGALGAIRKYPQFTYQYILLALCVCAVYWFAWLWRIKRERGRSDNESVIRYYWRTRLLKGRF